MDPESPRLVCKTVYFLQYTFLNIIRCLLCQFIQLVDHQHDPVETLTRIGCIILRYFLIPASHEDAPLLLFLFQILQHCQRKLRIIVDADRPEIRKVVLCVHPEIKTILEIDQVDHDLFRRVSQHDIGHQHMQQICFSRSGVPHDHSMDMLVIKLQLKGLSALQIPDRNHNPVIRFLAEPLASVRTDPLCLCKPDQHPARLNAVPPDLLCYRSSRMLIRQTIQEYLCIPLCR